MFHVVEKNKKLVKAIMIAVIATFVFFGIGSYLGMGNGMDDSYVAKVGTQKIYSRDIDNFASNNPQKIDKFKTMFALIDRQLILNSIEDNYLMVTKKQLQDEIVKIPMFQDKNKIFSLTKYQDFLSARTLTAEKFEQEIQKQILIKEIANFFKDSYFSSSLFQESFIILLSKERNVSEYVINPQQFYSQITISESEINNSYNQNVAKYTLPEQAKVQYLELSIDNIAANTKPTESEINKYIANHQTQVPEKQVSASHILFAIPKDADSKKREQIKGKAKKILALVKSHPNNFKIYAKQYSEDPGSASNGGDLGYFAKGTMVKPFEDEAFKMKPGTISNLVETQFGFHIIKLNSIKDDNNKTYARNFAITQLQKQKNSAQLQKMVEQLNDITYNNPNTLEPAATKLGLLLQTSDWINKGDTQGTFSNSKTQNAIFSNDVIKKHNNTEVIDLGNNNYAVYRVIDYKPSKVEPLSSVKDKIITQLKSQKANDMASNAGHAKLAELKAGKIELKFGLGKNVSLLSQTDDINSATVKQIFSIKSSKFPAYTGTINQNGSFVLYRINSESINPKLKEQNKQVLSQLENDNYADNFSAYLSYLKTKYPVDYKLDKLTSQ